jgi:hypothetical protein
MNTLNRVTRFLQAWQEDNYEAMNALSQHGHDDLQDKLESLGYDVNSFEIESISKGGNPRKVRAELSIADNTSNISFDVYIDDNPFGTPVDEGIDLDSVLLGLRKIKPESKKEESDE